MATFGDQLRAIRATHGLTQEQLADLVGTSKQVISRYENNQRSPKLSVVQHYAEKLGVPVDVLAGSGALDLDGSSGLLPLPQLKSWSILGATACGDPIHREVFDETVMAPADINADVVFRCDGDSMTDARIRDGDLVFIRLGPVDNGQIGVVRIGESYTLKRVYTGNGFLQLVPANPAYEPRVLTGPELEDVEVVGRAVCFLSTAV